MKNATFLLGRLIFGGFFLYNGINHLKQRKQIAQYAQAKKVPAPDVMVAATGVALLIGGGSILLGIKPKIGGLSVAGFLAGVSPIMHDFWKHEDPGQRANEMANFMKNVALLGAALALTSVEEPWPVSLPIGRKGRYADILAA